MNFIRGLKKPDLIFSYMSIVLILALLYFFTGQLSFYLSLSNSIVTISIFFPEGIALAAVILFGKKVIPGIYAGQTLLAWSAGLPVDLSLMIGLINALEGVLAYELLKRFKFDATMVRIKDLYLLFLLIMLVLQPFSALSGTLLLWFYGLIDGSVSKVLFSWWFGNSMGQILLTPALLFLYHYRYRVSLLLSISLFILFGILNYFFIQILHIDNIALLFSLMIPLMMFISTYLGLYYAAIAIIAITLSSLIMFHMGLGIFSNDTVLNNLININFYILAQLLIVYIHGVLIIEKEGIAEELFELNENLKEKISEEVKKNRMKDRMMMQQSRQAQIGEMIAMIAHQWKQPLNALSLTQQRFYNTCLQGRVDKVTIERFHKKSQIYIRHMSETIEDFRLFFKPEEKSIDFDLKDVVMHVESIIAPLLRDHGIKLKLNVPEELWVKGYRNELGQVLLNLIANAKDALELKAFQQDKYIMIEAFGTDKGICIAVEDNAGGIPPADHDRIFDAYFSTKGERNGTGLGLYIAKMIIERHMSGSLNVENTVKGARFNISIGFK